LITTFLIWKINRILTTSISIFAIALLSFNFQSDFLSEQLKHERVKTAYSEKHSFIEKKLKAHNISLDNLNLLLIAYKDDDTLDVYAKSNDDINYKKILSYPICKRSGLLGPKRKKGDRQVPEGFYNINVFNPNSEFYLSLGINYPNQSDQRKSKHKDLGGDIFIHGDCQTIGCLPMTDDFIKEIYLLAVYARNRSQSAIPVYIFPFKMNDENYNTYKLKYKENKVLTSFWDNIKIGYDKFHKEKKELNIKVSEKGDYVF